MSPGTFWFTVQNLHFTPMFNSYFICASSTILKCQGSVLVHVSLSHSEVSQAWFLSESDSDH